MCLMRMVQRACAVLWFPGHVLLMCVLVDTIYLACVHEAAMLPAGAVNHSVSDSDNVSSEYISSTSSSSSSPAAVPPPAALSSSSSSSSSIYDSETNSSYGSINKTNVVPSHTQRDSSSGGSSSRAANSNNSNKNTLQSNKNSPNSNKNSPNGKQKHSNSGSQNQAVSSHPAGRPGREFPFALVVASSTAAVSILLFFCLSYIWHTRQLDRRAQKLAIRLAAESEAEVNCSQCRTPTTYMPGSSQDSGTDSGGEEVLPPAPPPRPVLDELDSLNEEDEDELEGNDGSRIKPGGVGRTLGSRRGRRGRRSGSRSSRKWSGHSGGQNRTSLVTDQEILNHFASRRHSTFFI